MIQTHIAFTDAQDSSRAGTDLGKSISEAFGGAPADVVVVFASAQHDYPRLLEALAQHAGTRVIAGSSSAGEFTDKLRGEGRVSALGIRSSDMKFAVGLGQGVSSDPVDAADQTLEAFRGMANAPLPYRSALVMTDALAGHADKLVEQLTVRTGGNYRFFGGGAGDDGRFQTTHVFVGTGAYTNAVSALEILSRKPLGIGVAHGWEPGSRGFRVTEARGAELIGLDGAPRAGCVRGVRARDRAGPGPQGPAALLPAQRHRDSRGRGVSPARPAGSHRGRVRHVRRERP